ncbi:MAG: hypothetical protein ABUL67_03390, partial [Haliangium ochraceum]
MVSYTILVLLVVAAAVIGVVFGRLVARRRAEMALAATRQWLQTVRASALAESSEMRRAAALTAREEAEMAGAAFDAVAQVRETELSARDAQQEARRKTVERLEAEVADYRKRMDGARAGQKAREDEGRRLTAEATTYGRDRSLALEARAGTSRAGLRASIIEGEVEEARVAGVLRLRGMDQSGADPDQVRLAKRVMGIAVGRFSGHYLTERLLSTVPLPAGITLEQLSGSDESNLRAIESVSNVKLTATEGRDAIRMEGLDGVGR